MNFKIGDKVKFVNSRFLPDFYHRRLNTTAIVTYASYNSKSIYARFDRDGLTDSFWNYRFVKINDPEKVCKKKCSLVLVLKQ